MITALVRNYRRGTIHLEKCPKLLAAGRVVPWIWAYGKPLEEIREAITRNGGKTCATCKPLETYTAR